MPSRKQQWYLDNKNKPEFQERTKRNTKNWDIKNRRLKQITNKRAYALLKQPIYDKLGNKCACCYETEEKFLSIDHIIVGQRQLDSKRFVGSWAYLKHILSLTISECLAQYQLLCMNCNHAKGRTSNIWRVCPHENIKSGGIPC